MSYVKVKFFFKNYPMNEDHIPGDGISPENIFAIQNDINYDIRGNFLKIIYTICIVSLVLRSMNHVVQE